MPNAVCLPLNILVAPLQRGSQAGPASSFCSSFIAKTTVITKTTTNTQTTTVSHNIPITAIVTSTVAGAVPTIVNIVWSNCGIAGFDKGTSPAYWADSSGTLSNFAACSAKCQSDSSCASFAYGGTFCGLYAANV
jgi:hypothetical protein